MRKLFLFLFPIFVACSPQPKPIEYGSDICDFCRMTIVDQQHGAELVTTKAKVYKFDAIECMVQYALQKKEQEYALFLVNDYLGNGDLVDATSCTFLISSNIPSPMGAYLSAFSDTESAQSWKKEKSGAIYTWPELNEHLKR